MDSRSKSSVLWTASMTVLSNSEGSLCSRDCCCVMAAQYLSGPTSDSYWQGSTTEYVTAVRVCNACMQTDTQNCAMFLRFRTRRTVTRTGADRNTCTSTSSHGDVTCLDQANSDRRFDCDWCCNRLLLRVTSVTGGRSQLAGEHAPCESPHVWH